MLALPAPAMAAVRERRDGQHAPGQAGGWATPTFSPVPYHRPQQDRGAAVTGLEKGERWTETISYIQEMLHGKRAVTTTLTPAGQHGSSLKAVTRTGDAPSPVPQLTAFTLSDVRWDTFCVSAPTLLSPPYTRNPVSIFTSFSFPPAWSLQGQKHGFGQGWSQIYHNSDCSGNLQVTISDQLFSQYLTLSSYHRTCHISMGGDNFSSNWGSESKAQVPTSSNFIGKQQPQGLTARSPVTRAGRDWDNWDMCNSASHKASWSRHTDVQTAQQLLVVLVLPAQGWLSSHRGGSSTTHSRGYSGSALQNS